MHRCIGGLLVPEDVDKCEAGCGSKCVNEMPKVQKYFPHKAMFPVEGESFTGVYIAGEDFERILLAEREVHREKMGELKECIDRLKDVSDIHVLIETGRGIDVESFVNSFSSVDEDGWQYMSRDDYKEFLKACHPCPSNSQARPEAAQPPRD